MSSCSSGAPQNFRRGDRIRVKPVDGFKHYLDGLVGEITQVLDHAVVVKLTNDPALLQRVIGAGGKAGRASPVPQRIFAFDEIERISDG